LQALDYLPGSVGMHVDLYRAPNFVIRDDEGNLRESVFANVMACCESVRMDNQRSLGSDFPGVTHALNLSCSIVSHLFSDSRTPGNVSIIPGGMYPAFTYSSSA
jgi:hypothetical protein